MFGQKPTKPKQPTEKQKIGQIGEDLACVYLKKQGFSIVERNYWRKWGEIDVVAQRGNDLRFVEVKTVSRSTGPYNHAEAKPRQEEDYEPEDNIHSWKRKRLRRIIETYILQKDLPDEIDWQIDAISVYVNPKGELLKLEWLEDVVI